ncbi:hypothetical protein Tco_0508063 [Tanacetum coccineum]
MSHQTSSVPQNAYHSPLISTQPLTEFPQLDSGLVVSVFNPGDDPIACLNKVIEFMSTVAASRFPSTNNQLRTSSNPINQATIQDARVTVQQVQGRQEKMLLVQVQESGQILDEEQLAFLADLGILDAKAVLMANLSNYGSNVLFECTRKRLMRSDELHKFSDGTLQSVRDTLHDMANNLRMGYKKFMPRRKWSNLDKKRSHIMVKDINRQLLERRLMRSLEKFVGGRE